jgi:hypothetical protein
MNLKVASDGRLFVAVKTSLTTNGAALIGLLVRSAGGSWSPLHTVVTTNFEPTRPQCLLNEVDRRVYVFFSSHETSINYKTSNMDTIAFPAGAGTPIMASPTDTGINNPTTTKQQVNPTTGIVVVGSTPTTRRYWHASVTP